MFGLFRCSSTDKGMMKKKVIYIVVRKSCVTSSEMKQVAHVEGSSSAERANSSPATGSRQKSAIITASPLKEKIYCDICNMTLRGSQYKKHIVKHSSRYDFQCDVCKKRFKHKVNMNMHKMKIHGEAPTYSCQYCDFSTIHSSYLQVSAPVRNSLLITEINWHQRIVCSSDYSVF